jgi:hypothetical protein
MSEPLHQSEIIVLFCIVKFPQEANIVASVWPLCRARYETGWNKLWEGSPGDKPHLRYNFEVLVRIDHASGALLFARE